MTLTKKLKAFIEDKDTNMATLVKEENTKFQKSRQFIIEDDEIRSIDLCTLIHEINHGKYDDDKTELKVLIRPTIEVFERIKK